MSFSQLMKVLGFIISVSTFCWGIYTFNATQKYAIETLYSMREFEANKAFLEKQLQIYASAIAIAGRIHMTSPWASPSALDYRKDVQAFNVLLQGELRAVASDEVLDAATKFYEPASANEVNSTKVQELETVFVEACRSDLTISWKRGPWRKL